MWTELEQNIEFKKEIFKKKEYEIKIYIKYLLSDLHRLKLENHIGSLSILLFIYITENSLKVLSIIAK